MNSTRMKIDLTYKRNLRAFLLIISLILLGYGFGYAQDSSLTYSLKEVVKISLEKSPKMLEATTRFENQYWQYQLYKSDYRPQLQLSGDLPEFNRSITSVTQNDGSEVFKPRSYANSSLDLGITQKIGPTGGEIGISSQLGRIDQFADSTTVNYLASPAVITLRQPLFSYNPYRWDRKIEPMKFEAAKRQLVENKEAVMVEATDLFFKLLLAQERKNTAILNVANSDTLLQIANGRFNLGKLAENVLLQMELSLMNARRDLTLAELDIDLSNLQLAMFMGMTGTDLLTLEIPNEIPEFTVNEQDALIQAKENTSVSLNFEVRKLEGLQMVGRAKGESRLNANISASYGLTKSTMVVDQLYTNPSDRQLFLLRFDVPIIDWGRSKARIRTAMANKELIDVYVLQEQQGFTQEILLLVRRFNIYRQNMEIAEKADEIAKKSFDITMKRYLIGKVVQLDLKNAQEEKDIARLKYIQALYDFWASYYQLRQKTLYDFETSKLIGE
ncbi:MAG: hypothetical protein COB85_03840 [Bacteroidetes bacterium]|nr:MAG: hypothetical protein COB85_03840 [Bacteroidota bacterium]